MAKHKTKKSSKLNEKVSHVYQDENGYLNGFWNGIEKVKYKCVEYLVQAVSEPVLHWQNAFVGQRRQAVKVIRDNVEFYIDNNCGDGFVKIFAGFGSPHFGHKSINEPLEISDLPYEKWHLKFHTQNAENDNLSVEQWQKENYPYLYEQIQRLKGPITVLIKNKP